MNTVKDKVCIDDPDVQQRVFKSLMQAMSRPGIWQALPTGAEPFALLLAALCDPAAGYADTENRVDARTRLHIGAPIVDETGAAFVLAAGNDNAASDRQSPHLGTLDDPHLSTTFILVIPEGGKSDSLRLEGPGVSPEGVVFDTGGLHPTWLERREVWVRNFPLGVDFILIKGASVAALPRTARILKEDSQ